MKTEPQQDRTRPAEAGFTLVEIMVVIVILGLLATLVARNVIGASDEARITKAQTDCATIAGGVTGYRAKHGRLPDSLEVLWTKDEKGRSELEEVGNDPWDNAYQLREGNGPNDWEIISFGPDGSEGTEDDISHRRKKDQ
ncbi:MAG: type secretion system protein GspG [Planctomycetota bacterium]|jgi:general secretion pathway protein G